MSLPITYVPKFISNPDEVFESLKNDLAWVKRGSTPRLEYYFNSVNVPYVYGSGQGVREYLPQPNHKEIEKILNVLEKENESKFEVCFLNRYLNQSDHLGWHADDSPEMDDNRPIAIISLGVEREIWFCPKDDKTNVTKLKLEHGSLCLMHPGMQDTHLHRIPKASFECGERISLTFRGFVSPKS